MTTHPPFFRLSFICFCCACNSCSRCFSVSSSVPSVTSFCSRASSSESGSDFDLSTSPFLMFLVAVTVPFFMSTFVTSLCPIVQAGDLLKLCMFVIFSFCANIDCRSSSFFEIIVSTCPLFTAPLLMAVNPLSVLHVTSISVSFVNIFSAFACQHTLHGTVIQHTSALLPVISSPPPTRICGVSSGFNPPVSKSAISSFQCACAVRICGLPMMMVPHLCLVVMTFMRFKSVQNPVARSRVLVGDTMTKFHSLP